MTKRAGSGVAETNGPCVQAATWTRSERCHGCGKRRRDGVTLAIGLAPECGIAGQAMLCSRCIAQALEIATGYQVITQVERWDVMRKAGRALGPAADRSERMKRKLRERESAVKARKGQVLGG